jgi:hypothetical protein
LLLDTSILDDDNDAAEDDAAVAGADVIEAE